MRNRHPGRRAAARLATIAVAAALPTLIVAAPALALHRDDGAQPGPSLGAGLTILYYVVIPVGAFMLIAALAILPSALSRPRYRPGKPWDRDAQWVGGPTTDAASAAGAVAAKDSARGGASAEW